jgi:hypothetical protein
MKRFRCPHCNTPFDVVPLSGMYGPTDSTKGIDRHLVKCARMSEEDRAYYYQNRRWKKKSSKSASIKPTSRKD